jgi:hypothetical protein
MTLPSTARTQILDNTYYNGYPLMMGPIVDVQSGVRLRGGRDHDEIVVTTLAASGAGSFLEACQEAEANGGWITFADDLDGTIVGPSRVTLTNPDRVTIDARGRDIAFPGLRFSTSGNPGGLGHYFLINGRTADDPAGSTRDNINFGRDTTDMSPLLVAFWHFYAFNAVDGDEALDTYLSVPDNNGVDQMVAWCHFEHVTDGSKKSFGWICGGNSATVNQGKFRSLSYRNFFENINFRTPRMGRNDAVVNGAYGASLNNSIRWTEDGITSHHGTNFHSYGDIFDARATGNSSNAGDGAQTETSARLRVDAALEIRSSSFPGVQAYTEANRSLVPQMQNQWASIVVAPGSTAIDTINRLRSTACLLFTQGGTIENVSADQISGTTFTVECPSTRAVPASIAGLQQSLIDDVRVLDENFRFHPDLVGSDIFTSTSDVVRTDSRTLTFTASANLAIDADIYLSFQSDIALQAATGKTTYAEGWNPIKISATATPPGVWTAASAARYRRYKALRVN